MKKFAVVLAGCGVYDGAEIHESVATLIAIDQHGAAYDIFAPDIDQHHVINHLTGKEMPEKRNVLVESARIARGKIRPLSELRPSDYDALIFPGGFGVAKNLSTFAFDGSEASVLPEVENIVRTMHRDSKPIGALCIAPAMIARVLGDVKVTIGNDPDTVAAIERMGGTHVIAVHGQVVVDEKNKIFTTPCYMIGATISQVYHGAYNVVTEMIKAI